MKKKSFIAYPYVVWLVIFTIIPMLLILYYSFTVKTTDGSMVFSLENYKLAFDPLYVSIMIKSLQLAFFSTLLCFILGYPVAYILAHKDFKAKNTVFFLLVVPMWMNFLLRTYGWLSLLEKNGIINYVLAIFGFEKRTFLYTNFAVLLGMVYNFLPFMILPIYTILKKMDQNLIEAAQDLGANSFNVFNKVIFPLSIPAVVSGTTMVFMPAVTTFIISSLLGGGQYILVGNLIQLQFLESNNWNFGSAISIFLMVIILISMGIFSMVDKDNQGGTLL